MIPFIGCHNLDDPIILHAMSSIYDVVKFC